MLRSHEYKAEEKLDLPTALDRLQAPGNQPTSLRVYSSSAQNPFGDAGAIQLANLLRTNDTLTLLDFQGANIKTAEVMALAEAIKYHPTLKSLNLGRNSLDAAGQCALADMLAVNTKLEHLDLTCCYMNRENVVSLKLLAEAIKKHPALKSLNFGWNPLDAAGQCVFADMLAAHPTLEHLDLNECHIDSPGVVLLAEAIKYHPTLKSLNLAWNEPGADGVVSIAKMLAVNTILEHLDLACCNIDSAGVVLLAEAIKNHPTLKSLNLAWSQLGADGLVSIVNMLVENTKLEHLDLSSDCNIDSAGAVLLAEAIKNHPTLKSLNLADNPLGADGLVSIVNMLVENTKLEHLDLSSCSIDSAGVVLLAEAIKNHPTLKSLVLSGNTFGFAPNGASELAAALEVNHALTHLSLVSQGLGAEGGRAIAEALKTNCTLTSLHIGAYDWNDKDRQEVVKLLQENRSLTNIQFVYMRRIPPAPGSAQRQIGENIDKLMERNKKIQRTAAVYNRHIEVLIHKHYGPNYDGMYFLLWLAIINNIELDVSEGTPSIKWLPVDILCLISNFLIVSNGAKPLSPGTFLQCAFIMAKENINAQLRDYLTHWFCNHRNKAVSIQKALPGIKSVTELKDLIASHASELGTNGHNSRSVFRRIIAYWNDALNSLRVAQPQAMPTAPRTAPTTSTGNEQAQPQTESPLSLTPPSPTTGDKLRQPQVEPLSLIPPCTTPGNEQTQPQVEPLSLIPPSTATADKLEQPQVESPAPPCTTPSTAPDEATPKTDSGSDPLLDALLELSVFHHQETETETGNLTPSQEPNTLAVKKDSDDEERGRNRGRGKLFILA